MVYLLELNDANNFRAKMSGYEHHMANNLNLVNKIIKKQRPKPPSEQAILSLRNPNSPRSLQAGPFAARGVSIGAV